MLTPLGSAIGDLSSTWTARRGSERGDQDTVREKPDCEHTE
jgi:hypothetical protein